MPSADNNLEEKIIDGFERLSALLKHQMWLKAFPLKLNPIQLSIVRFLYNNSSQNITQSFLAEQLFVTKATLSDSVKTLKNKDLLELKKNPEDTRSSFLVLTKLGVVLAKDLHNYSEELTGAFTCFKEKEKKEFYSYMLRFLAELNDMDLIPVQRLCFTCKYYDGDRNEKHFCNLLNKRLNAKDLQINCAEHEELN